VTPPLALEESEAVLGAILINPGWMDHARLNAAHFYDPTHAALWDEFKQRQRDGRLVDLLSLKAWALTNFRELGGPDYLMKLTQHGAFAAPAHIRGYADIIREASRRRAVMEACKSATYQAEKGDGDALTTLEQRLQEIASNDADSDAWERLGVIARESVERSILGETKGISTGFPSLDRATGGLQPGTLWVVGGATSMGKSVFGAGLGRNIAAQGYGVAEVHLEMDATQIGLRTATALAFSSDPKGDGASNPFYLTAQRGELTEAQQARLIGASKASAALPIYTDARAGRSLSQIEAAARRLFRKMRREGIKPGALIIDHEGLIAPDAGQRFPSQLERANARSEALLAMAKRLGVAVIALSQITKEGSRADGEERLPQSTDLNYGSAISQAASVVILIHRRAYYAERKPEKLRNEDDLEALRSRETTLVVDKARGGMRAQVGVLMDMPTAAVWEP
jgi:replicative DNA helicase